MCLHSPHSPHATQTSQMPGPFLLLWRIDIFTLSWQFVLKRACWSSLLFFWESLPLVHISYIEVDFI